MALGLRILIYAVLLGVIAAGMMWGAAVYGQVFYNEAGPVETLETVFAMSAALIFLLAARIDPSKEPCSILLAGFLFMVFIRESDYLLDTLVCRHAWEAGVTLVLLMLLFYTFRHLKEVYVSVLDYTGSPGFGIFISGLLTLIVFSRLYGAGVFWREMLDHPHFRVVKKVVEEGVEQMGYFLIFVSACEDFHDALDCRQRKRPLLFSTVGPEETEQHREPVTR